jgi:Big-like domain-containing protein
MITRKSGLLGLILGVLVLGACEPEPDPQPDITVTVVPDTATLTLTAPDNARQFTAVVNGHANQAVIWRSSVPAVATVSTSGLVTAVAAGGTQIIAIAQADTTKRDAAAVNVTQPNAPTVTIVAVRVGGSNTQVTPGNVRDQIDVVADLQRPGGAAVSRMEFLLDAVLLDGQAGRPNCTQTFTSGGSADLEVNEAAEQIICSINTAAFVETSGAPAFANGNHSITARAVQPSGNAVTATTEQLTFNNPNFINATVTFVPPATRPACVTSGTNVRSIDGAGSLWCTGDVRVALTPVNYGASNQAIASATVNLRTKGTGVSWFAGGGGVPACRSTNNRATDPTIAPVDRNGTTGNSPNCAPITKTASDGNAADGLAVTFASNAIGAAGVNFIEDVITFTVNTVTTGGSPGPVCINPTPNVNPIADCGTRAATDTTRTYSAANQLFSVTPFRLDNLAPRVLEFDLTPDACTTTSCYLNGAFTFAPRAGFYTSVDYGVNHQNAATLFQAGAAAASLTSVTSAQALDNTATSNELLLRVSSRDSLGNTALLYATDEDSIVSPNAADGLRFGIDKVPPIVTAATRPPNNGANDSLVFNITAADTATAPAGPSGINNTATDASAAVIVRAERIPASGTPVCLNPTTGTNINCSTGGNLGDGTHAVRNSTTFNLGNATALGYYRVTYAVRDVAGNVSANTVVTQVKDTLPPGLGPISGRPSTITGNSSITITADASDNLDLGDALAYVQYGAANANPIFIQNGTAPTEIGTYGPDTFTTGTVAASVTLPNFMRSVQRGLASTIISRANRFILNVRDVVGVVVADPCPALTDISGAVTDHCRMRREDDVGPAVTAGLSGSAETNFDTATVMTAYTTNAPSAATVCNGAPGTGNNQPCPSNPSNTTLTASATGPTATFTTPFDRVNFYYSAGALPANRLILIGTGTAGTTQDTGNNRTFNWSINWTPAGLAAGTYQVFAIGVDSKGQGLLHALTGPTVTIAVD